MGKPQAAPSHPEEPLELSRPGAPELDPRTPADPNPRRPTHPVAGPRHGNLDPQAVFTLRGQTLNTSGQAVPFVQLQLESFPEQRTTSDARGGFEWELSKNYLGANLVSAGGDHATLVGCRLSQAAEHELQFVVVAPAVDLSGRVSDEAGRGLAKVQIDWPHWNSATSSFPYPLDRGVRKHVRMQTDEEGRFTFESVPSFEGGTLEFSLAGFVDHSLPVPSLDQAELLIVLSSEVNVSMIRGLVRLPDGSPAQGAEVAFDEESTRTDEWGWFELSPSQGFEDYALLETPLALAAALEPYGTAILEDCSGLIGEMLPELPQALELNLRDRPLSLSGRLVDPEGLPLPGWQVNLLGGVALSMNTLPSPTAEALLGSTQVLSDAQGGFELKGLLPREYGLWAYDQKTLRSLRPTRKFQAGEQKIELQLGEEASYPELRGVVVAPDGQPIANAHVQGTLVTARSRYGTTAISGSSVKTDAEGRFVLQELGKQDVTIDVSGQHLIPRQFKLEEYGDPLDLRLEAWRRCHVRLFLGGVGDERQRVRFEDQAGELLRIYTFQSNGWRSSSSMMVDPQEPGVLAISESATTLLVGAEDPVRHAIQLIPGEVTELHIQQ